MITNTTTTHCFSSDSCLNIISTFSEIEFTDYATHESVHIEGFGPKDIQRAIIHYVHNVVRQDDAKDHISWLEDLIIKAEESIHHVNPKKEKKS